MMHVHRKGVLTGISLLAVLAAIPVAASAQEAKPAAAGSNDGEIVVTAQKREQTVQDVPFAITATTGEALQKKGASGFGDYLNSVPGVNFKDLGPGISDLTIRGASGGQVNRDETEKSAGVGVYFDESPISLALFNPDLDYYDIERVEVLRGPQGTLYGAGSLSGTVRVISKKPTADRFEGSAEAGVNTIKDGGTGYSAKGMINVPLGEHTAIRAVGYYNRYGGFIDTVPLVTPNLGTLGQARKDVNSGSKTGGRLSLRTEGEEVTATFTAVYQHIKANGLPLDDVYNVNVASVTGLSGDSLPATGKYQRYLPTQDGNDDKFRMFNATLEWHLNTFDIVSSSTYIDRTIQTQRDQTLRGLGWGFTDITTGAGDAFYYIDNNKVHNFTQELRVVSTNDSPFQWIGGVFYQKMTKNYWQWGVMPNFEERSGIDTVADWGGLHHNSQFDYLVDVNMTQKAAFGELTYKLSDTLSATAGLRAFEYKETRSQEGYGYWWGGNTPKETNTGKNSGVNPRFLVSYAPNRDVRISAIASRGFKLGSVNPTIPNTTECDAAFAAIGGRPKSVYDPETLWNYELDAKITTAQRRVTIDAAVYHSDYSNIHLSGRVDGCAGGLVFTSNAGQATIDGQELEVTVKPVRGLSLAFSGAHTVAKLSSNLPSVITAQLGDLKKGDPLPNSPKWTFTTSANYETPISDSVDMYLYADYSYVGKSFSRINDLINPNLVNGGWLDAYGTVTMRAGLRAPDNWEASIYVNNLTNKAAELALDYEASGAGRQSYVRNAPRTIGLTLRKFF